MSEYFYSKYQFNFNQYLFLKHIENLYILIYVSPLLPISLNRFLGFLYMKYIEQWISNSRIIFSVTVFTHTYFFIFFLAYFQKYITTIVIFSWIISCSNCSVGEICKFLFVINRVLFIAFDINDINKNVCIH